MLTYAYSYTHEIVREYERIKKLYTTPNPANDNIENLVSYDAQENGSYLERVFTEDEFDWFEDIETNLPINLLVFQPVSERIV
jgi:hypothetical protein